MGLVIDVICQLGEPENKQILPSVRFAVKRHNRVFKNKHQAVSQSNIRSKLKGKDPIRFSTP
jgi:hypothetical protein